MKKLLLLVLLVSMNICLFGQTQKAFIKAAEKAIEDKDYYSSLEYYQTALDFMPKNIELQYKVAESARLFNAYELAEQHYQMVLDGDSTNQYPLAAYRLGQMQLLLGKYEEASSNLSKSAARSNQTSPEVQASIEQAMNNCKYALGANVPIALNCDIIKLDETVNSPWNDFAPSIIGGTFNYTSMRFLAEKEKRDPPRVYAGILERKGDENVKRLAIGTGKTLHYAHSAINQEGNVVYLTICENLNSTDIRCDLYKASYENGNIGTPQKLAEPINAPGFTTTQPSLSFDEKTKTERLYFVSDRTGGKGYKDIYYADIQGETIGAPVNLTAINTDNDEITPYFHAPSSTLYFSSDGYTGLGGYDVFTSKLKENNWTVPANVGKPVNSSRNDLYYWVSEREDTAFFASNRDQALFIAKEKNACCNDIFLAKYIIIKLNAFTFETATKAALNGCKIQLYELTPEGRVLVDEIADASTNMAVFKLLPDKDYEIVASKNSYDEDKAIITTKGISDSKDIIQNLYLRTSKIELDLFTFDDATKAALPNSMVQLFDISDGQAVLLSEKSNPTANDYKFTLDPCKTYRVVVSHDGYTTYTEEFKTPCDGSVKSIRKDVYLQKSIPEDYLPLAVYFDNDIPDKKSMARTTRVTYNQTYVNYLKREDYFESQYSKNLIKLAQPQALDAIHRFFEDKVKNGKRRLDEFSKILLELLQKGEVIELEIQGYCSPLASSSYNLRLGSRRVSSMMNHFRSYKDGALLPYIKSGQLKLREISFGKDRAPQGISSSRNDTRSSIFSPEASAERRSEVLNVNRTGNGTLKK